MENDRAFFTDDEAVNVISAAADASGERLDVYVSQLIDKAINNGSRSMAKKLIESGSVTQNGKISKPNSKVKEGDIIEVILPEPENYDVLPENIPLDIIYEDEDLAVINKPKGMVVHPAPGNTNGTLVNAIMYHIKDLSGIGGIKRPGIVHRIDKMTSGLIVIAKNDSAHISLSEQIKEHSARRVYLTLVNGNIKEDFGTIDIAIGRHPQDRKKMTVKQANNKNGVFREAITHFKVLERFSNYTLVEANLETGRTHQIRVHMAHIKHPVVGDDVYGSGKNPFGIDGQALHAVNLYFKHPRTDEVMRFYAPLPDYFKSALKKLNSEFDMSVYE